MRGIFKQSIVVGFLIPFSSWAADGHSSDVKGTQNARISVMVLNVAPVPAHTLSKAQKQAGEILGNVGVDVEWIDCQLSVNAPVCTAAAEADRLTLTIVTEDNPQMYGEDVLGRSVVGNSNKGVYARVFYAHIQAMAERERVDTGALLGLAIAHEFGHLLIGPNAHSPQGIMRANWSHRDIELGIQGRLQFTAQQAPIIRAGVQSRIQDRAALQN
jgi:hypothetical protein